MSPRPGAGFGASPPALPAGEEPGGPAEPRGPRSLLESLRRPQVAWVLALALGCLGTWAGLLLPFPGLAVLLAALPFAPVHVLQVRHEGPLVATAITAAWLLAVAVTALGVALETTPARLEASYPWWVAADGTPRTLGLELGAFALLVLLGLPAQGVGALLLAAALAGAEAAGLARWAVEAVSDGEWTAFEAVLVGWPPARLVALLAGLLAGALARAPAPRTPDAARRRRQALVAALGAGAGALLLAFVVGPRGS